MVPAAPTFVVGDVHGQLAALRRVLAGAGLIDRAARWLAALPALANVGGGTLLAHADATFYREYGDSVIDINQAIADVLSFDNSAAWHELIERFTRRREFMSSQGGQVLDVFLAPLGA